MWHWHCDSVVVSVGGFAGTSVGVCEGHMVLQYAVHGEVPEIDGGVQPAHAHATQAQDDE